LQDNRGPLYRFIADAEEDTPSQSGSSFSDDPKRAVAAQESLHSVDRRGHASQNTSQNSPAAPQPAADTEAVPDTTIAELAGMSVHDVQSMSCGEREEWRQQYVSTHGSGSHATGVAAGGDDALQSAKRLDRLRTAHLFGGAAADTERVPDTTIAELAGMSVHDVQSMSATAAAARSRNL